MIKLYYWQPHILVLHVNGSLFHAGWQIQRPDFESNTDAQRRFKSNLKFVAGKKIADFGCGNGDFLKLVQPHCNELIGIELQQNYIDELHVIDNSKSYYELQFSKYAKQVVQYDSMVDWSKNIYKKL